ncbi:MAG: hypothetical protein ABJI69_09150 [Balneola sp.]
MTKITKAQIDLHEHRIGRVISGLDKAVMKKDKSAIMNQFHQAKKIDFEIVSKKLFDKYDSLVDTANDIIYS